MKIIKTINDCWNEKSSEIKGIWGWLGLGGGVFGVFTILNTYNELFWVLVLMYFPLVIILPFIYYIQIYENFIKISKENPECKRENKRLLDFHIYGDIPTISDYKFRVGDNVQNYFLFFTKNSNVHMEFTLPNKSLKQIERRNKFFYIIRCGRNETKEFFLPIASINNSGSMTEKEFKKVLKKRGIEK